MDSKSKKNLIIAGIIGGVLLIGGMVYSLVSYEYDPSVADNDTNGSISAEAGDEVDGEDVQYFFRAVRFLLSIQEPTQQTQHEIDDCLGGVADVIREN